jgi:hypothetical protein
VTFFGDGTAVSQFAGAEANEQLGYSVALENADALAGRPTRTILSQPNTGSVNTFSFSGGVWATNTINLAQTGAFSNYFYGYSVDISGAVAVIGAPASREDALNLPPGAPRAGVVETLEKPGVTWAKDTDSTVIARFDLPNTATGQTFALSVDMTSDWLVVGVQGDAQRGLDAGAVYVYRNISGVWTPHSRLTGLYSQAGDFFGRSVAIFGTRIIVGAPGTDGFPTATSNAGSFYVYELSGSVWRQMAQIQSPNPTTNGFFGTSLDYQGDVLVVGATGENGNRGRAYAYRNFSSYASPITIDIAAASVSSSTGFSVSVFDPAPGTANDEVIAIGAYNENSSQGAAYVASGATFSTITTLVDPNPGSNRYFGYSVSIDNGRVAVGAPTASAAPSGRVVVFSGSGYSTATTLPTASGSAGQFGFAVNLQGNSLVIGSVATAARAGLAHVYGFSAGNWTEQGPLQPSDLATLDEYGSAVAQNNGLYVVGAPLHDANSIANSGAAYVFSLAPEVTVTPTTLSVAEAGTTTDTFTVSLNQAPPSNVTVQMTFPPQVQVDAGAGFGASPQTVTLTPANALSGVTVTVRAIDDAVDEADPHSITITTATTTSAASRFNLLPVADLTVDIADNDTAGATITQTGGTTAVTESGTTDTYSIVLDSQPTGNVNVTITFPASDLTVNGDTDGSYLVTFTTGNWNTPQTIMVGAANDRALEGDHTGTLVHAFTSADASYNGVTAEVDGATSTNTLTASITDNESAVLEWVPTSASAAEGAAVVTAVRLDITADPVGGTPTLEGTIIFSIVRPNITTSAGDFGSTAFSGVFNNVSDLATDSVTQNHANDTLVEGDETYNLALSADIVPSGANVTVAPTNFTGTIIDTDIASVVMSGGGNINEQGARSIVVTLDTGAISNTLQNPVTAVVNLVDGTATYETGTGDFFFVGPTNTTTFTFPAGSSFGASQALGILSRNDGLVEGNETFTATFGAITGASSTGGAPQTYTIVDNDSAAISFAASTSNAPEGTTPHVVNASLAITANTSGNPSPGTPQLQYPISVVVNSTPNTATTPADYTLASTSITFPAAAVNASTQPINVTIVDDVTTEGPETFDLGFGTVTGAGSASGSHTVTIVDNDIPGITVTESAGTTAVTEGGATDSYTVVLDSQPTANVNVNLAFDGAQLTVAGENDGAVTLTFTTANWNTAQTVTVAAFNDTVVEGAHNRVITQTATSADAAYAAINPADVSVSITDNDTATLTFVDATSSPSELLPPTQTHLVNLRLDIVANGSPGGTLGATVTMDVVTTAGTATETSDYALNTTSLGFLAGAANGDLNPISVEIVNDRLLEGNETFTLSGANVTGPATVSGSHVVTIVDDEVGTIAHNVSSSIVSEGVGNAVIDVTLTITGSGTGGTGFRLQSNASVNLTNTPGTATNPADYGNGASSIIFTNAEDAPISASFNVPIVNDSLVEANDETFSLGFGTVTGPSNLTATSTHTVTIDENDTAVFSLGAATATVAESAGTFTRDVTLTITSNPAGGSLAAPLALPYSFTVGGANPAQSPADFTLGSITVTFAAGSTSATTVPATVNIVNDAIDEVDETVDIDLNNNSSTIATNISASNTRYRLTITDDDTSNIVVTESGGTTAITEGGAGDSYDIVLTSQPTANVTVNITFDSAQVVVNGENDGTTSRTFTPANWDTPQTVTVSAVNDSVVEANPHTTSIVQTASSADALYNVINPADVSVSITENDTVTLVVVGTNSSVAETAGTAELQVRLEVVSNGVPGGTVSDTLTADVVLTAGTAVQGSDYQLFTGGFVFLAGAAHNTTTPLTVNILNDRLLEADETFTVGLTITSPTGTASGSHVVTITDDETGVFTFVSASDSATEAVGNYNRFARLTITGSGTGTTFRIQDAASIALTATAGTAVTPADFTLGTTTLSVPANAASPLDIPYTAAIVNDQVVEGNETFTLGFGAITGPTSLSSTGTHVVTITDNDIVSVDFNGANESVAENAGTYTRTVGLTFTTNPSGGGSIEDALTLPVSFMEGSAVEPEDFTLTTTSITFPAGSDSTTTQDVVMNIINDSIDEDSEVFMTELVTGGAPSFVFFNNPVLTTTIVDNDTAAVVVTESASSTDVTEGGAQDSYSVVLATQPTSDVTVELGYGTQVLLSTDGVNFNPAPVILTFTSANWNTPRTIVVEAVNDTVYEGAHTALIAQNTFSSDAKYNGINTADVTVNITDNESAALVFVTTPNIHDEGDSFNAQLRLEITANGAPGGSLGSTVSFIGSIIDGTTTAGDVVLSTTSIGFGAGSPNNSTQEFQVAVIDDRTVEALEEYQISVAAVGTNTLAVTLPAPRNYDLSDNDLANVSFQSLASNAPEATTPHAVQAVITFDTIGVTGVEGMEEPLEIFVTQTAGTATTPADYSLTTTSLTFTITSVEGATQPINIAIVNDGLVEVGETFSIGFNAVASTLETVTFTTDQHVVTIVSDDAAGVTVTPTGANTTVTEGGATDTFDLVLTAQPTSDVTITLNAGTQVTTVPTSLTFTTGDWNVPQTVTVTAVDDLAIEGAHSTTIGLSFAGDANFAALTGLSAPVSIVDNDVPGVNVLPTAASNDVTEGGLTDTFDVTLFTIPSAPVTITFNGAPQVTLTPSAVTFDGTNWNVPQTVTITAVDDRILEGLHTGSITLALTSTDTNYNGLAVPAVTATITDGISQLVRNGSFESQVGNPRRPSAWTREFLSVNDIRTCTTPSVPVPVNSGSCAFLFSFSGPSNLTRRLTQTFDPVGSFGDAGDTLDFSAFARTRNLTTGARLRVFVYYDDGTNSRLTLPITQRSGGYQAYTGSITALRPIDRIVIVLEARQSTGRLWLDDVSLLYTDDGDNVRAPIILSPPNTREAAPVTDPSAPVTDPNAPLPLPLPAGDGGDAPLPLPPADG